MIAANLVRGWLLLGHIRRHNWACGRCQLRWRKIIVLVIRLMFRPAVVSLDQLDPSDDEENDNEAVGGAGAKLSTASSHGSPRRIYHQMKSLSATRQLAFHFRETIAPINASIGAHIRALSETMNGNRLAAIESIVVGFAGGSSSRHAHLSASHRTSSCPLVIDWHAK